MVSYSCKEFQPILLPHQFESLNSLKQKVIVVIQAERNLFIIDRFIYAFL